MEKEVAKTKGKGENVAKRRTRDLVYIALFCAVICVCSFITVPAAVPFTMQLFGIFLTLVLLGGKRGTAAVVCYIALGAFGVPVFSGFRGGIDVLAGVTGGYIVGFLFIALIYWGVTRLLKDAFWSQIVGMVVGLLVCYAFGTAWFVFVKGNAGSPVSVGAALMLCVVPFLPFDIVKIILATMCGRLLEKHIK